MTVQENTISSETMAGQKTYRIAAIPADGIGPEVIAAGLQALEALARRDGSFRIDVTEFDWSSERYRRTGALMPEDRARTSQGFRCDFLWCGRGSRRARPLNTLGPASAPLPGVRPVCQRSAHKDIAGHHLTLGWGWSERS